MDTFKFNRLDMSSVDGTQLNMEALYRIAPSVFTEALDPKTGKVSRKVDFEALRQLLGDNAFDGSGESYQFTWVGKNAAKAEAARPTDKTLRPVPEDSVDWDNTKNLYIEGDNLEVLKLLQRSYLGRVKMIYIDPPYNTGNDFVYDDDFARTVDEEERAAGDVDEFGNRYRKNTDSNGRFHSDWCSMIYPRLLVARSLLAEDGVIFISIDDHELENLRKVCDEIYGKENFVANLVWEQGRKSMAAQIAVNHEYCLIYCKNRRYNIEYDNKYANKNWKTRKKGLEKIYAEVDRLAKLYGSDIEKIEKGLVAFYKDLPDSDPAKSQSHYKKYDPCLGIYHPDNISQGTGKGGRFPIIHPVTGLPCKCPSGGWRFAESKLPELLRENRIAFGEDETTVPCLKRFLKETENEVFASVFYKDGRGASKRLDTLMGAHIFDYPKDEDVIKTFVSLVTSYVNSDSLILDFFSGSATTAHAVMKLNAEDSGKRRFIMVQLPEQTNEKSEAYKAGYKNICEIGKERIRRAGKKIKAESPLTTQDLDAGFRVFRLDESNYEEVAKSPKEYSQDTLNLFENNIKADRNDLDLLFGAMLAWGVTLDLPMTTETVDGCTVYTVNEGDLVACFTEGITDQVVAAMAGKMPLRVLFRDACFKQDDQKINIYEQFKQLMNWTDDEAFKNIRVI